MEKRLKCILLLSLKEMALRKVAVFFWNDPDIVSKELGEHREGWKKRFEDPIKKEIMKLCLPSTLMEQLTSLVIPISLEIKRWKSYHQRFLHSSFKTAPPSTPKLCWTAAGTINYQKTAEELVRCTAIDIVTRYEIACNYCLQDYISLFWEELPEEKKREYNDCKQQSMDLSYYWPLILLDRQSRLDYLCRLSNRNLTSFNQFAFEESAKLRCKTAAEYFLRKLTQEEREISVVRSFQTVMANRKYFLLLRENDSDVLFLLSAMNPEQQVEAIKEHPVDILVYFLQYPLQDLFVDNAELFWFYIPPSSYTVLIEKLWWGYNASDFYFPKIFTELFMRSPKEFKKCFVEENFIVRHFIYFRSFNLTGTAAVYFLSSFLIKKDSECIKAFFRAFDTSERVKFVQESVSTLFCRYVVEERCDLVLLCLREATLSKEEKQRTKEAFERYLDYNREEKSLRRKFETIFHFLDETVACSDELKKGQNCKLENCSSERCTVVNT